jgi:hypothetical protein
MGDIHSFDWPATEPGLQTCNDNSGLDVCVVKAGGGNPCSATDPQAHQLVLSCLPPKADFHSRHQNYLRCCPGIVLTNARRSVTKCVGLLWIFAPLPFIART